MAQPVSVAELQARIDALSADIVRQKKVLTTLENSKSAIQRQLNAVRDPVGRLPLEISSEIFIQCLPSCGRLPPDARLAPLLFLNVCTKWADIALATTQLWASVHVDSLKIKLVDLLDTWVKRAGNRALSISLPHNLPREAAAILGQHSQQLQDLKMFHDDDDIGLLAAAGTFPFLNTLTMSGIDADAFRCTTTATMAILRACPNLVECTFDDLFYDDNYNGEILVLPHVRTFNFGTYPEYGSDYILRHVNFPGLQFLFVPLHGIHLQDFLQFLRRSSPPLQELIVGDGNWVDWTADEMDEYISLLPTLTHFELPNPRAGPADHFLAILADSPHLLPNLRTATLRSFDPPGRWYQGLADALFARRKQIQGVRIIWSGTTLHLTEEVALQLRQLIADGMSIHIGPEDRNYLRY